MMSYPIKTHIEFPFNSNQVDQSFVPFKAVRVGILFYSFLQNINSQV